MSRQPPADAHPRQRAGDGAGLRSWPPGVIRCLAADSWSSAADFGLRRRPRGRAPPAAGRLDRRSGATRSSPGSSSTGSGSTTSARAWSRRPTTSASTAAGLASRAARLAGRRAGRPGLEPEGDPPPDRHLGDLPAGRRAPTPRRWRVDADDRLLWRKSPAGWRPRWSATRCSPSRAGSTASGRARLLATIARPMATGTDLLRCPVDPVGPGSTAGALPAWARGRPQRAARRLRLPRPLGRAARRTVTTTPLQALALMNNAFVAPPGRRPRRRLRRECRHGPTPRPAGRPGLSPGLRPSAASRRARAGAVGSSRRTACAALPGDLQQQRIPVRRLIEP